MESRTCIDDFQNERDIREYLEESTDNIVVCFVFKGHEIYHCESRDEVIRLLEIKEESHSIHGEHYDTYGYPKYQSTRVFYEDTIRKNIINDLQNEDYCFYKINSSLLIREDRSLYIEGMEVRQHESYTYEEIMSQLEDERENEDEDE